MNAKKAKQIRRYVRRRIGNPSEREYKATRTYAPLYGGTVVLLGTITLSPDCPRAIYKRMKRAAANS